MTSKNESRENFFVENVCFYFVFSGHPGTNLNCNNPIYLFGCNIIGNRCTCEKVPVCGDEIPFMFSTRDECSVNLAVMLDHESSEHVQKGKRLY